MKVYSVSYGGGHAAIVSEIVKNLSNEFSFEILALTVSFKTFDNYGIEYKLISEYLNFFDLKEKNKILSIGRKFSEGFYNKDSGVTYFDTIAYFGIAINELLQQGNSEEEILESLKKYGREILCPIKFMEKILTIFNPNIVLLTSNVRYDKACGVAANNLNIPVIRIVDLPNKVSVPYNCCLCVINEYTKNLYTENERVVVTGNPALKVKLNDETEKEIIRKFGFLNYRSTVIFADQPGMNDEVWIKELIKIAKRNTEILFILKLHPGQPLEKYKHRFGSHTQSNFIINRESDINYLLKYANIVITFNSTVGLQAYLLGKSLITIREKNITYKLLDYNKLGISEEINEVNEMELKMFELLQKEHKSNKKAMFEMPENPIIEIYKTIKEILYES